MSIDKSTIDYRLYLVTDRFLSGGRSLEEIAANGIAGGVGIVQLREKDLGTRDFIELAFAVREVVRRFGVPLVVNDRVDVALACGADGVHLGQEDMECRLARRILGPDAIVGVSVINLDEALRAEAEGADYLGVGPLFPTATKPDAPPPIGLSCLADMRAAVRIPLVGIGGIKGDNAGEVIRSGADGIAVVSAIVSAPDPEAAAGALRREVESALAQVAFGGSAKSGETISGPSRRFVPTPRRRR